MKAPANTLQIQPSPNFNAHDPSVPLRFIVLHYTDMVTAQEALARLCDAASEVSAHYLIDEGGTTYRLVEERNRAWHAGKSSWGSVTDMNSASIGIELANPGHANGYRPFPRSQIESLKILVRDILARHGMDPRTALLGHADIAPGRKQDPGELFPWTHLAAEGLGLWPIPTATDYAPFTERAVQESLRTIGYACPETGDYDRPTRDAILAFQRRYHPTNLTGTPESETVARMRALVRLLSHY